MACDTMHHIKTTKNTTAGCSASWNSFSTINKSPFQSPRKTPTGGYTDRQNNNNSNNDNNNDDTKTVSPRKKIYYSEKQSDDVNGVPSVPPCTPGNKKITISINNNIKFGKTYLNKLSVVLHGLEACAVYKLYKLICH